MTSARFRSSSCRTLPTVWLASPLETRCCPHASRASTTAADRSASLHRPSVPAWTVSSSSTRRLIRKTPTRAGSDMLRLMDSVTTSRTSSVALTALRIPRPLVPRSDAVACPRKRHCPSFPSLIVSPTKLTALCSFGHIPRTRLVPWVDLLVLMLSVTRRLLRCLPSPSRPGSLRPAQPRLRCCQPPRLTRPTAFLSSPGTTSLTPLPSSSRLPLSLTTMTRLLPTSSTTTKLPLAVLRPRCIPAVSTALPPARQNGLVRSPRAGTTLTTTTRRVTALASDGRPLTLD
mmetsp:Transcript_16821/g.52598  ORF Transcript_16821/g.52598 Transcript_16821/m.52598 type:complete len:288 (+) Transcript_16821:942-1805(+)